MRGDIPNELPGHWRTGDGAAKAREYADLERRQLEQADMTDMELANAIFMLDAHKSTIGALPLQTAAKDRIRWLSVQLALAKAEIAALRAPPKLSEPDPCPECGARLYNESGRSSTTICTNPKCGYEAFST